MFTFQKDWSTRTYLSHGSNCFNRRSEWV